MRNRMAGIILGLALAAGGVAGALALVHSQAGTSGATRSVLVALRPIAQGATVGDADVGVRSLPDSGLPDQALTSPDGVVNAHAVIAIPSGSVMLPSFVSQSGHAIAAPTTSLLPLLDGDVAITIPNDPGRGVGNFLQPGDRIDILVDTSGNGTVKYGFQDVLILKTAPNAGGSAADVAGASPLLVVEASRREAEALESLVSGKAGASIIAYALRPSDAYGKGPLDSGSLGAGATDPAFGPSQMAGLFSH